MRSWIIVAALSLPDDYPPALPAGTHSGAQHVIDPSRVAVRGPVPAGLANRIEERFEDEDVAVLRATPEEASAFAADRLVAVYILEGGPAAFVPTGRVTVRFEEGIDARERAQALHDAGYRITDVPAYATQLAWVEAANGTVAAALAGIPRLLHLPDVAHVEPQLLTQRSLR